jgi:hypothetical protein
VGVCLERVELGGKLSQQALDAAQMWIGADALVTIAQAGYALPG